MRMGLKMEGMGMMGIEGIGVGIERMGMRIGMARMGVRMERLGIEGKGIEGTK